MARAGPIPRKWLLPAGRDDQATVESCLHVLHKGTIAGGSAGGEKTPLYASSGYK